MSAERNIIFIGMPGSGKSTVAKLTAAALGRAWFDSDTEIERREAMTCAEIFAQRGEEYFRALERNVVAELTSKSGIVISLGGGAPLRNADLLRRNSVVVYLTREIDSIVAHLAPGTRPLSQSKDDLLRLYSERRGVYEAAAHVTVSNDADASDAAALAVERVRPHLNSRFLIINGPNLNLLGEREPGVYGTGSYADLLAQIETDAAQRSVAVSFFQSNHEGAIIDALHDARGVYDGIVINPGAYTHYSYAILDALSAIKIPTVEVHISDVHSRESFRRTSVTAGACVAQISGEGFYGYTRALDTLLDGPSKNLAVIGHPITHSKSPQIQNDFALQTGEKYHYTTIDVTPETLADFLESIPARALAGFNITMPLKEQILPHLDEIDASAAACGSVNTVVVRRGALIGYSTDGLGTLAALREVSPQLGNFIDGKGDKTAPLAVILGTGGAAKAAAAALDAVGVRVVALSRRDSLPEVAGAETRPFADLKSLAPQADIVINATPLGMHGHSEFDDLTWLDALNPTAIVFDFVYHPAATQLLIESERRNLTTIGGLRLLVHQAAEAFRLFTGTAPAPAHIDSIVAQLESDL